MNKFVPFLVLVFGLGLAGLLTAETSGKTIILETQKIEGKLKKPQVALISAEKRPVFKPIALIDITARKDILSTVDPEVFENRVYTTPFPAINKK